MTPKSIEADSMGVNDILCNCIPFTFHIERKVEPVIFVSHFYDSVLMGFDVILIEYMSEHFALTFLHRQHHHHHNNTINK